MRGGADRRDLPGKGHLTAYAERTGQARWNLYKRRTAAVARLKAAVESGELSDPYVDAVTEATATVVLNVPAARKRL
ncbi:hypothetical protein GCM10022225_82620 [Plantactinospora mayteni]|uniref:Uncharacterized protein n=1 Tax=Plantactinospora mayteni TaxID=566021 RepID=A0ABQ4F438_9ACTN|nr:hypothetical protein [Plantactinospora mayteni]GIH01678.1 hypothetical protein Pma05_82500 [Plantactinospora mayteni]